MFATMNDLCVGNYERLVYFALATMDVSVMDTVCGGHVLCDSCFSVRVNMWIIIY